jgi:polysaccharide biosynthesis transport protein
MKAIPFAAHVRRCALLAALTLAATVSVGYALGQLAPKEYAATASFVVDPGSGELDAAALATRAIAEEVANNLQLAAFPEQLLRNLRIAAAEGSRVVRVIYTSSDPGLAAQVANEFVRIYAQGNVRVLDEASALPVPAGADFARTLALGAVLGGALGGAFYFLRAPRARPVRSETELAQALGAPVASVLPRARSDARGMRAQAEALSDLALRLKENAAQGSGRVLAVVGACPEEGRSFLASRLGASFAELGEPTLLIDVDLRAPHLHALFGVENQSGLAEFLSGARVKPVRVRENLWLMPAGEARREPMELLGTERFATLLGEAGRRFGMVLLDTPAAAHGRELERIAALAGGVLVVARRGRIRGADLEALRTALRRASARVLGAVLNRA